MRVLSALIGLLLVAVGVYLVVVERGGIATTYAIATAVLAGALTVRALLAWTPAPEAAPPLHRLVPPRRAEGPPRPAALLEWEAALLAARVHDSDEALRRRLEPLVEARLRDRRGIGGRDPLALELLGPAWERLRGAGGGRGAGATSLDDLDDLCRRLEAL